MKACRSILGLFVFLVSNVFSQTSVDKSRFIDDIFVNSLTKQSTYPLLSELCNTYTKRLSGSAGLEGSMKWSQHKMEEFGFDNVHLQEVLVPHWVRGDAEEAFFVNNKDETVHLKVLALGRSVGTPDQGVTAEVVEVSDLKEIASLGKEKISGKIVFINKPFEQQYIDTFKGYSATVPIRSSGPSDAARYGAVACVIRSVSTANDDNPHTGALKYAKDAPCIPAAALGVLSAKKLSSSLKHNPKTRLTLKIHCQTLPDNISHNVIGEISGSEHPERIIMVCGHLDAWDAGTGAQDDGAGCMQVLNAIRTLQLMGYKPLNTLRVVLVTNEENGLKGAKRYAEFAVKNKERHIFALESDAGGFTPRIIKFDGSDSTLKKIEQWLNLFPTATIEKIISGGGGSDVGPLNKETGTPVGALMPDSQRYFDYHHSAADVLEAVNPRELELGTASIASFVYLVDQLGLQTSDHH